MLKTIGLISIVFSHFANAAGYFEEWNFAELQREHAMGVAQPVPWVGHWWPYAENGIADGNFDKDRRSPAEKLDLSQGNRNWATAWEFQHHGHGLRAAEWWGHCNGWAVAAIMEPEPRKAIRVDGVKFTVSDRKALLTEYWMEVGADFIGTRVWNSNDFSSRAFWDVTPAQFHLAMTNIVGRQSRSLIVDRHAGAEVWNHPVVAYKTDPITPADYLGPDSRYSNIYRVNITTTIWWATDEVEPDELTLPFNWEVNDSFVKRKLRYELWIDAPLRFSDSGKLLSSGNIIITRDGSGGAWKNGTTPQVLVNTHPDFMWIPISYSASRGSKNPRINDAWIRENIGNH